MTGPIIFSMNERMFSYFYPLSISFTLDFSVWGNIVVTGVTSPRHGLFEKLKLFQSLTGTFKFRLFFLHLGTCELKMENKVTTAQVVALLAKTDLIERWALGFGFYFGILLAVFAVVHISQWDSDEKPIYLMKIFQMNFSRKRENFFRIFKEWDIIHARNFKKKHKKKQTQFIELLQFWNLYLLITNNFSDANFYEMYVD